MSWSKCLRFFLTRGYLADNYQQVHEYRALETTTKLNGYRDDHRSVCIKYAPECVKYAPGCVKSLKCVVMRRTWVWIRSAFICINLSSLCVHQMSYVTSARFYWKSIGGDVKLMELQCAIRDGYISGEAIYSNSSNPRRFTAGTRLQAWKFRCVFKRNHESMRNGNEQPLDTVNPGIHSGFQRTWHLSWKLCYVPNKGMKSVN